MDQAVLFRAQFIIAWPIWAGGYPLQKQAYQVIEQNSNEIKETLEEGVHSLLSPEFYVSDIHYQIGTHAPVSGLFPSSYVPNSINLILAVSATYTSLNQQGNLSSRISDLVEDLAGLLQSFAQSEMPGAKQGANIYDVTSKWDAGPGLQYAESGEPLQNIEVSTKPIPPTSSSRGTTKRTRVFISYSHRDSKWLTRLQVHTMPLVRHFGIDLWDDTKIKAGMKWQDAIREAIETARVAILLISADFMASEFIAKDELPPLLSAAKSEGALILPVIVSPSMFLHVPELNQFQSVNKPSEPLISLSKGRQEKVFSDVALAVKTHLEEN